MSRVRREFAEGILKKHLRYFFACLFALGLWAASGGKAFGLDESGWKFQTLGDAELSYETNVFNLSSDQIDRLEAGRPEDEISGRYDDMDSVDDAILTPRLRLEMNGPGLFSRDIQIRPGILYHFYSLNEKKSHLELGLDLEQEVGAHETLGLEISYAPDVFKKNYLSDATDLTGSVSASERVYEPATYDDAVIDLTYRRRLRKNPSPSAIESVYGEVLLGYQNKEYEDPFENRSEDSIRLGAGLDTEFNKITLAVSYLFEYVETPGENEVLILDEADFNVDFNSDGDALDTNIRAEQKVDRSRLDHTIAVKASAKLNKDWTGEAKYDLRLQDYKSAEPFDAAYRDREDIRHRIGLGVEREFGRRWSVGLGFVWAHEEADKGDLPNIDPEEPKSYDNITVSAGVSYRL